MPIDTKKVSRRQLNFSNEQQVLVEAERLAAGRARPLGNWTMGQILKHLAIVMNGSIDGLNFSAPWYVRLLAPLFKKRLISSRMPAGFKLPRDAEAKIVPPATISTDEGLAALRSAVERQLTVAERKPSPVLGLMTREEWTRLHCRHAELHLSFLTTE